MDEVILQLTQILHLLTEIRDSQSKSYLETKSVWTVEEFAVYSGYSVESVYQLTSQGKLPHSKPNGKFIFIESEKAKAWLTRNPIREESLVIDSLNQKSN